MDERDETRPAGRLTPYELVFSAEDFEARVFPAIREEAATRGVDAHLSDRFHLLASAGDAVRSVVPADAPPEMLGQYRALLFQAYNFWRYGRRIYLLDPAVARYLVEAAPTLHEWDFALPHPSAYLQLPPNLFWGSISPDSTPEPVDGLFATAGDATDPLGEPYRHLELLVVLGIRRNRAGFSVIPLDTEVGPGIARVWAETPGREAGVDYENVLPGGELSGLYSILTATEVFKLAARAFWFVESFPDAVVPERAPERRAGPRPGSPPASHLPYHRVTLGGEPG